MRISPISLRAFLPTSQSRGVDSVRPGPVVPVEPIRPVVDMMNTRSLMWESGKLSGSTMRRALMSAWLNGRTASASRPSQLLVDASTGYLR